MLRLAKGRYPDQNPSALIVSWIQAVNASEPSRPPIGEVQRLFGGTAVAAGGAS
jgi:hypothetical protein